MNERVKKLTEEIHKLSSEEQAELIELLVLTYREPDPEIEKELIEEVGQRIDAYDRGETTVVDAREALRKYKKP